VAKRQPRTIGERVRYFREEQGLTMDQLAAKAGMGQSALSLIESGQRPNPRPDSIVKIAKALYVTTDQLLGVDPSTQTSAPDSEVQPFPLERGEAVEKELDRFAGLLRQNIVNTKQALGAIAELDAQVHSASRRKKQ